MGRFEKLQAAVLLEGDAASAQFEFELETVMGGAKEGGLAIEGDAFVRLVENAIDDGFGLGLLITAADESGCDAAGADGVKRLFVALLGFRNDGVSDVEDGLRAAVVIFEGDDGCAGELLWEIEDVADGGGAEGVDRLGIVANDGDAGAVGTQVLENRGLEAVGVLVFVDKDVGEAFAEMAIAGGLGQECVPEEKQIVVVEKMIAFFASGVGFEEGFKIDQILSLGGVGLCEDFVEGKLTVDDAAVDVGAEGLAGEVVLCVAEAEVRAEIADEIFGVGTIEDREVGGKTDRAAGLTEESYGDGVEGSAPDRAGDVAVADAREQCVDAAKHFGCGAASEGEEEDTVRVDAAFDEPGDAASEGRRFAGACTGDDKEWFVAMGDGLALGVVEVGEESFVGGVVHGGGYFRETLFDEKC